MLLSRSVMSDFLQLHGLSPTRLVCHGLFQAKILEWGASSYSRAIFPTKGLNPHLLYLLHWQPDFFITTTTSDPSIRTSNYNRLNYGRNMHSKASCYITCSCQSSLSVNNSLGLCKWLDYANDCLEFVPWSSRAICLPWRGPPLSCVLSVFFVCAQLPPTLCNLVFP